MKKRWYEYLWMVSLLYIFLGFFNILFAWLGLFCFFIPIIISVVRGDKLYCNKYCGRGQMLEVLQNKFKLSRYRDIPSWMNTKKFRYGFLIFFMIMFINMLFITSLVLLDMKQPSEVVRLFWSFQIPWEWASSNMPLHPWVSQFAFGFYSIMLTSTLLGIITMMLYKPRAWCVYCPMGTMTQLICKGKNKNKLN